MSVSTCVQGFKPPDETWVKMKAVWDACEAAAVPVPDHVAAFFGYDTPDAAGVEVSRKDLEACGAVREWQAEMEDGFEIDISKVPADVKIIRVYTSY